MNTKKRNYSLTIIGLFIFLQLGMKAQCTADFSYNLIDCNTFQFTDMSTPPPGYNLIEWFWSFDDGVTSNQPNPVHFFNTGGFYNVTLTVTADSVGYSCTDAITYTVQVPNVPTVYFTWDPQLAQIGELISFFGASGNQITSWEWDFDDGMYGNDQNIVHSYYNEGDYNVSLTVTDINGCSSVTSQVVTVGITPAVDFYFSSPCLNEPVQFTVDESVTDIGAVTVFYWDFGDGATSNNQNPTHIYSNPGTYQVILTIVDTLGLSNSVSHEVELYPLPTANFEFSQACLGSTTQFTDYSVAASGYITTWEWDFGDGTTQTVNHPDDPDVEHIYINTWTFGVTLTVTTSDGCQNTVIRNVQISDHPLVNFYWEGACYGMPTYFYDETYGTYINSWWWDFGDPLSGSNNSTEQNPSHIFSDLGDYTVTLVATNVAGCGDTVLHVAHVNEELIAGMTFQQVCEPSGQVYFFDETISTGNFIDLWIWDFGDGEHSYIDNPEHIYDKTDTCYQVSLEVTNFDGCIDVITEEVCLFGTLEVDFSVSNNYEGQPTIFYANYGPENDSVASYSWNFGDGTPIETTYYETIQHIYSSTGGYQVELSALDTNGCLAQITHEVVIYPLPIVPAFPDSNAIWNTIGVNNLLNANWHFRYGLIGDTLMSTTKDSFVYHKIYQLGDSILSLINSTYFGTIRTTADKKVFVKLPDLPESLLYDYSLEVGDTAWFTVGGGVCEDQPEFWEESHYKVVSLIDSVVLLNNETRNRWHFQDGDTWIEGLGSVEWFGLFNPLITNYSYCGDSYSFACYKEDDRALYIDQPDCETCFCDMMTTVEHPALIDTHLSIYPNPAKDMVHVSLKKQELENAQLRIFDVHGLLVIESACSSNQPSTIDTKNWKSGLYIVLVSGINGELEKGTFVVE